MSGFDNDRLDPVETELLRIAGNRDPAELKEFFLILPLIDETDALSFLRTVPAGAAPDMVQRMASAYRAARSDVASREDGSRS